MPIPYRSVALVSVAVFLAAASCPAAAQTYTESVFYSFCINLGADVCGDGNEPNYGPIQASDGNFYGTTGVGGQESSSGTVYQLMASGNLNTIYSFFCYSGDCTAGHGPAGLVQGTDGNFYGAALLGDNYGGTSEDGDGAIFQVMPNGTLTTLYAFCSSGDFPCPDGSEPQGDWCKGRTATSTALPSMAETIMVTTSTATAMARSSRSHPPAP